jgi:hypothetical protein
MAGDYTRATVLSDFNVRAPLVCGLEEKKYGYLFHLDIGLENVNNK